VTWGKGWNITDEVIKEEGKVFGQQMNVTNFVHRNLYVFFSVNGIYCKDGAVTEVFSSDTCSAVLPFLFISHTICHLYTLKK
jgi:hypothetical protein